MRMPWKMLGFAVALCALAACKDQPVAPQADAQVVAGPMAADYMNNPDNGNPKFYRGNAGEFAICWTDPGTGLRACHWSNAQLADYGCGDIPLGESNFQVIYPSDPNAPIIANLKGTVWIRVRDTNASGDCFGNQLVATGWGTFKYNDNNTVGNWIERAQDAYGYNATGNLVGPDGQPLRYNGHMRCQYNAFTNNPDGGKCQMQVNVN